MPRLVDLVLVGLGGSIGSLARYAVGVALAATLGPGFPYGTLVVNLTGSFAAGVLLGVGDTRGLATSTRLVLLTGFLGGYTTFSAFGAETVRLAEQQGALAAVANVAANVGIGLAAAVVGIALGRAY
jgi:CrcB protein